MHYRTFYRGALVLPLLLPGLVTLAYHGMVGAFMVFAGFLSLSSGEVEVFLSLSALGAVCSLVIGYFFVALIFLVRYVAGHAELIVSEEG